MNISNGIISEVNREMENPLVTVEYGQNEEGNANTIRLVVDERTIILDSEAQEVMPDDLEEGMIIDARTSDAMTRSIPPQATAYLIRIVRGARPEEPQGNFPEPGMPQRPANPPGQGQPPQRPANPPGQGQPPMRPGNPPRPGRPPMSEDMTTGRIWNINRNGRNFDTITGQDISTLTRFNVPANARILNRMGRPIDFSELMIGMRVQVRHANFMTASIPPQTTAFEIRVL